MYKINYVSAMIDKSKMEGIVFRVLRLSNLFLHLIIILLIWLSFHYYGQINEYDKKIISVKSSIAQKRETYKVSALEKEWEKYYFRLTAVKEQLEKVTDYSIILKELGIFLPSDDFLETLKITGNNANIELNVKKTKIKTFESPYDYRQVLQTAFKKSKYFDKETINIDSVSDDENETNPYILLRVKMPVTPRKD